MTCLKSRISFTTLGVLLCFFSAHSSASDNTKTESGIVSGSFLTAGGEMQFQAGDGVKIVAFPDAEKILTGIYSIDQYGYADLPLIGMTMVAHKTPSQVEHDLSDQYGPFLSRQHIMVRLMFRAALIGGFEKPGFYWVDPRGSLWNTIYQAGGILRDDGIRKVHWISEGKVITRDITPYFQPEQSLVSIGFKSGDQLTVTSLPHTGVWGFIKDNIFPTLALAATLVITWEVYHYHSY